MGWFTKKKKKVAPKKATTSKVAKRPATSTTQKYYRIYVGDVDMVRLSNYGDVRASSAQEAIRNADADAKSEARRTGGKVFAIEKIVG